MLHGDLTDDIIGCAMKVHTSLGSGFQEAIYQRAMKIEMGLQKIRNEREMEMTIFYTDVQIGTRRVDFFVENKIMVELKAVSKLDDMHLNQAMNYLEAYNLPVGLLINFGGRSLEFKRVYNPKHPKNKPHKLSNPINPMNPSKDS